MNNDKEHQFEHLAIQDWQVMCGIETGTFFIMRTYSSKDDLKAFCKCLIQQ
jgi:hypothetical protein